MSVLVTNICGASAAIDNGSSDPDNDLVGCTQDPPGPYPIGTTELVVTLSCTDSQNQSATCTGKVTVTDGVVPELVLNGPATQTLECLSAYTDPGAIANDLCSGDLSASIVTTGTVNKDTPGTYTVSYNVTDASGNSPAPVTRTVTVNDTQYPIIMLDGPNPMVLECALGNLDNDPMATVSDACHGNTSHTVFREFTDLNINQVGNYFARYQGDDTAGHAVQITRNVNVVDTTAPVLTVWTPTETVECGIQPSLGVTATDACYGNVPVIATPASLPSAPGPYTVTYSAVDPSGNGADGSNSVVRTITVVDSEPPTLVSPVRVLTLACGEPLSLDVVATDGCEGDLSSQVQLVAPDLTQPGTYPVHYHVSDSSGNTARSAPFTVTIPDPRQPVLTARGHSELTLECNVDAYVDPGAQAWDGCSTPLPLRKYNSGQDAYGPGPDTSKEGTYYVEYFARNEKWHVLRALRAVTVVDRIPPVLTLQGAAHLMHNCGSSWVDPGAEALDTCYGDLGSSVVRTGQVNVNVGGLYTLRYEVKDSAGLSAPPVERTVQIVGCPP
ncbi:MAG TPA: DUF5011 domain-containing protein [Myxococcaceae bacterium]|nr:DUF5011 domain-containing protein [Myxococcaceae bacterium]